MISPPPPPDRTGEEPGLARPTLTELFQRRAELDARITDHMKTLEERCPARPTPSVDSP